MVCFRSCTPWKRQAIGSSQGTALWTQGQVNPKILGASLLTHVVVSVVGHPLRDPGSFHIGMLPSYYGLQVFQGKGESGGGNFLVRSGCG